MSAMRRLGWLRPAFYLLAVLALIVTFGFGSLTSFADSPQQDLEKLNKHLDTALTALPGGDIATVQAEFKAFNDGWYNVEDGVKGQSKQTYQDIETAMGDVKVALATQPLDTNKVLTALQKLDGIGDKFINAANPAAATAPADQNVTIKSQVAQLDTALTALDSNNTQGAADSLKAFRNNWPSIETLVLAKSTSIYGSTENNMALAAADLQSNPPKLAEAKTILSQMRADLAPFAQNNSYGIFDAAIVLLREGLEALLVLAALLTFLAKSGNARKQKTVWLGAGIGVALSAVVAVIIEVFFSAAAAGSNRELIEGITGLVAAGMLFYMSYWLHSKSQAGAWQKYIKNKASSAIATGSVFSLGLLAFLAIFREGTETAILYLGIAPSIALSDLLIGLGIGAGLLGIMAVFILVIGVKLPMRPFFLTASVLVFYIGFKFIGTGIHSLQVAQVLPSHSESWLPSVDFFGIYPTWETTAAQIGLLVFAIALFVFSNRKTSPSQVPASVQPDEVPAEKVANSPKSGLVTKG